MKAVVNDDNDASSVSQRLFKFSFGSPEGPESIADLSGFIASLKDAKAGALSQDIKEAARSYIASAITKAGRLEEGQNFNPKTLQDFLRTNGDWMRKSGVLDAPQIEALDKLTEYTAMLRRTERLRAQSGSHTNQRGETGKTFIDEIMHPWVRHMVALAGLGAGGHHGGGAGAMVGAAAGAAFEHQVMHAETAMRELMAEMVLNSDVAKQAMMKASPSNRLFLSPRTKELLGKLRLAIQADVAPSYLSPSLQAPAPVGKQ